MSNIETVKAATDIVDVIGSRISMQRSGSNFRALCPFHSEKSPSFFVSETMQRYKCFGCGENGDVFTFLEKYEGMTFGEALEHLAERAGIQLERRISDPQEARRRELLEILELAKEYYQYLLQEHAAGAAGRTYLKQRGTTATSQKIFNLGYSLPSWDGLWTYLAKKKQYSPEAIEQTGLVIRRRGGDGFYDRFRNRLMFPLRNHRGQVVGFSGRILDSASDSSAANPVKHEAKYINTPETQLYHKGQLLYGYSELLQPIRSAREVVVVEGEFDVISSVQAHVDTVCAVKGSALTSDHVRVLSRTVDTIMLALDADAAGVEATKKAVAVVRQTEMSRERPLDLRVIQVGEGKDPDELARSNPKAWREATKHSVPAYEFLIRVASTQHDPSSASGKRLIMHEIVPVLAGIDHAVELEHYIQFTSQLLKVSIDSVKSEIARHNQHANRQITSNPRQRTQQDTRDQQTESTSTNESTKKPASVRRRTIERYLLFLLSHSPDSQLLTRLQNLHELSLVEAAAPTVIAKSLEVLDPAKPNIRTLSQSLPADLQERFFAWYSQEEYESLVDHTSDEKEWQTALKELKELIRRDRAQEISRELSAMEEKAELSPEDEQRQAVLLAELVKVQTA